TLGQVRDEGLEISHVASISASVNAVWPSGAKRVPRFTGAARRTTGFPRPDSPGPRAEPPGPRAPATGESRPPRAAGNIRKRGPRRVGKRGGDHTRGPAPQDNRRYPTGDALETG